MTGWRLGWLTVPESLLPVIERITEFSVSCAPAFTQAAGAVALAQGEPFIAEQNARYQTNLRRVQDVLGKMPQVFIPPADATFYAFFQVAGVKDNLAFARRIIAEARVGIAPGKAFDADVEDWFRICVAVQPPRLEQALQRLSAFLAQAL